MRGTEGGGADSEQGAGDGDGRGTGHSRLEGELTAFRAEFESLAAETTTDGEEPSWATRGRELLDRADDALADDKIEQGWHYLHAAKRLKVYGLEALNGTDALRGEARELLLEAEHSPLSWRAEAVRERLATDDGTLREVTRTDVRSAYEWLHEGYQRMHLKRHHLQAQVSYLRFWAVVVMAAFLLFAGVSVVVAEMPSPYYTFADADGTAPDSGSPSADTTRTAAGTATDTPASTGLDGESGTPPESQTGPPSGESPSSPPATTAGAAAERSAGATTGTRTEPAGFLIYVLLVGMLGACLFGLRSIRKHPVSTSTPQYLTGHQVVWARIVVGAGSALAVFFFLRSGLVPIDVGASPNRGTFLLGLAFVAGYSERLAHTTVESIAGAAGAEVPDSGEG